MRTLSVCPSDMEGTWKPRYPLRACTQTCLQALTWSLVEGQQLKRPRDMWGKTQFYGFEVRAGGTLAIIVCVEPDTCSLKEGSVISVLSPPPKNQVWDCIGLMESAYGHSLGDALGPCPLHRWYCIARDTLDTGRLVPPPEAVCGSLFCSDRWPASA